MSLPVSTSASSREKYSHHAQNVISTPPAMTAARAAGGCGLVDRDLEGERDGEHRLAQHDDEEQPVPLGDVVRVPRGGSGLLGVERHGEVCRHEDGEQPDREVSPGDEQGDDPAGLHDQEAEHVPHGRGAAFGVARRGTQPHQHQSDAHDDVADDPEGEVGLEDPRDAGSEHQRAEDLQQRQQSVQGVVGVVGRVEPGEVEPRPPDREEGHREVDETVCRMPLDDLVVERQPGLGDRDDVAEVGEQLERRGGAVALLRVAR